MALENYELETEASGDDKAPEPLSIARIPGSLATRLAVARRELLDPSLRNPLLNYRPLKARGVEIVGEVSSDVFRLLVAQGRELSFAPKTAAMDEPVIHDGPTAGGSRRVNTRLKTSQEQEKLQKLLLATYRSARTSIEEQGVNVLFLALGMLRWYDKDEQEQPRHAPLILVPVELERSNVVSHFHMSYTGEEIDTNLSLVEKLNVERRIALPPFPEPDELDVDAYFDAVEQAIRNERTWAVERDAIALGFFSFAKLLMFKDLDPTVWPDDLSLLDHPILKALLGDGFRHEPSSYSEGVQLDSVQDAIELHTVMDADSSQTLAILDVLGGRNMVIQGPPGTGKSQTITNIIAEALAQNLTVLFVAEKLAALEVVKRRLDMVGLGDACLELHSRNTQKKVLLEELRRTLELGRPQNGDGAGERRRLAELRGNLNDYAAAVNEPIGESKLSPHEALGHVVRLRQRWGDEALPRIEISGLGAWDAERFGRLEERSGDLQAALRQSGVPSEHPFSGSRLTRLVPADERNISTGLERAEQAVRRLAWAGKTLAEVHGYDAPVEWAEINVLIPPGWQFWRSLVGKDRGSRAEVQAARAEQLAAVDAVLGALRYDASLLETGDADFVDRPFQEQLEIVQGWRRSVASLRSLVAFNTIAAKCRSDGYDALVEVASTWDRAVERLVAAVQYTWFHALIDRSFGEREHLAVFSRESHEHTLAEFQRLDERVAEHNSAHLAKKHWDGLPHEQGGGQLAVLKREFEKKTRHLPIRQLMSRAGHAVRAIKPVFMMSPLSIANYLPPGSLDFDLVIFDEASQVRPVDALGALARGKQAAVVGDTRQLPPTSFFDSLAAGDDDDLDEDAVTGDMESVLSLFSAQLAPDRMLRWHYRSRHESLIAVSNHAFYNDKLVVFPSPDASRDHAGLRLHHLPDSVYDRGKTRTNHIEARAVADACMVHARTEPELSLGVAAFSVAQMRAIEDELEILRRQDPSVEDFFNSAYRHERFFIKNLETVQGDERDVIFISIGYGRDENGRLAMSFGPLNSEGGERRLNVLITRAKQRCEVFTNLQADDIDDTGKKPGLRCLKIFLRYAEDGKLDIPRVDGRGADSPFEESVFHELTVLHGYEVRQQVGASGFRIDLAVVDPDHPGRYLLGIECDGASYHSAQSARDRDRLRQRALENLGWRIHRIWSTDWFRDQQGEVQRLVVAIEAAKQSSSHVGPVVRSDSPAERERVARGPSAGQETYESRIPPYQRAQLDIWMHGRDLHQVDSGTLADWIASIVRVESPVHAREVMHRIAEAAGVQRVGNRIETAMNGGIRRAVSKQTVVRRGDFLWSPDMETPAIRSRADLPTSSKKLELVSPEEIDEAIRHVVRGATAIDPENMPAEVGRLLGFGRVSVDMRTLIKARLQSLLSKGRVLVQGQYVALP